MAVVLTTRDDASDENNDGTSCIETTFLYWNGPTVLMTHDDLM